MLYIQPLDPTSNIQIWLAFGIQQHQYELHIALARVANEQARTHVTHHTINFNRYITVYLILYTTKTTGVFITALCVNDLYRYRRVYQDVPVQVPGTRF